MKKMLIAESRLYLREKRRGLQCGRLLQKERKEYCGDLKKIVPKENGTTKRGGLLELVALLEEVCHSGKELRKSPMLKLHPVRETISYCL